MRFIMMRTASVGLILLLLAGCVPLPAEGPTIDPSPTATMVTIARSTAAPTDASSGSATAVADEELPATGIPEVDRVIEAGLDASGEGLRPLLRYLISPCTQREGLGGPPKCAIGEDEGTPVEVFPIGGPEASFTRADETPAFLPLEVTALYGVYRVARPAVEEAYFPAGDWGVVFMRPRGLLLDARISGDGIVRVDYPPVGMGSEWWDVAAEEWLVEPREQ